MSRDVWRRLTTPPPSLSKSMQEWVDEMGVDITFPEQLVERRLAFVADPWSESVKDLWLRTCEKADVGMLQRLRACIVSSKAARPPSASGRVASSRRSQACWCTSGSSATKAEGENIPMAASSARAAKVSAAIAHWKLNRVIEQGSSYFTAVCPGSRVRPTALAAELNGEYVIPDAADIDEFIRGCQRQRAKLRVIATLRDAASSSVLSATSGTAVAAKNQSINPDDEDSEDEVSQEAAREAEEYLDNRARESTDLLPFPTVEITLKEESNLMDLKVHMSDAQVRFLLRAAKEDEPGSRSTFAFRTEAVCLGENCWFGVSGVWKKKIIWIVCCPDAPAVVDSIVVDGVCWVRRRHDEGAKATDPFQCTVCGNVRCSGNVTYSHYPATTVKRGKYLCLICAKDTVHVSLREDLHRRRPRWDPTSGNPLAKDMCGSCQDIDTTCLSSSSGKKRLGAPGSDRL